jgi:hypothetical protein
LVLRESCSTVRTAAPPPLTTEPEGEDRPWPEPVGLGAGLGLAVRVGLVEAVAGGDVGALTAAGGGGLATGGLGTGGLGSGGAASVPSSCSGSGVPCGAVKGGTQKVRGREGQRLNTIRPCRVRDGRVMVGW